MILVVKLISPLSDEGQISLDFVFGLGIFMIALVYLVTAIPGIFLPYQSNAVDLNSVAYRTSALLVEDPGWYIQPGFLNGTKWEDPDNIAYVSRIGLASSRSTPDVISLDKIKALNESLSNFVPYDISLNKLGLNNTVKYDYNLTILWTDASGTQYKLQKGPSPGTNTVDSIQRDVLVDEGKRLLVEDGSAADNYGLSGTLKLWLNGNINYTDNSIILTIIDCPDGTISFPTVYGMGNIGLNYGPGNDYVVYINGVRSPYMPISTTQGDRVDIVVNWTSTKQYYMNDNKPMDLWFVTSYQCFGSDNTNMTYDSTNPLYWSLYDKGILQLKVWT